jgi:hypothetical protein
VKRPTGLLLLASTLAAPGHSQARASLGIGIGSVRYEAGADTVTGGTAFSSAAFSPDLQYASPAFTADVSGSFASLPGGVWSSQGRGDLWAQTPQFSDHWRLGGEGIVAGTASPGGGWTAAAHGIGELLWSAPRWGFGIGAGPSAGWISDTTPITALHVRARAWWRPAGASEWQASAEPTRLPDGWFTDVSAGATVGRGPLVASLWAAARLHRANPSTAAGSAFIQLFVSPNVSLELGGGSYLRDPYQGLPLAGYVTFGVRLHATRHLAPAHAATAARLSPLVPEVLGDSLVVRFHFDKARSVAIAGDWTQWRRVPLRPLGADLWEGRLVLPRGLYHFNVLVDGNAWVVPNGVAAVSDGLGGMVGVLLVP